VFAWIWSHLPGSTAVRALQSVLIVALLVVLLFLVVFPWLTDVLPFTNTTVGSLEAARNASPL
jgi:hypothetical protein